MMMLKRGFPFLLLPALAPLVAHPGDVLGQQIAVTQTARGWVGIWVDYTMALVEGDERTVVVVKEVVRGSPAQAAGIRPGDTLTHVDGQPISQEVFATLTRTLEPGDLVRLTIHRNDREREVLLEAASRPARAEVRPPDLRDVVIRLDSVKGAILKNLDSVRVHIARPGADSLGGVSFRLFHPPPVGETRGKEETPLDLRYRMVDPETDSLFFPPGMFTLGPEFTLPFELMVVQSEAIQELEEELRGVRKEITEIRRRELARIREIKGAWQGPVEERIKADEEIQRLRAQEKELLGNQKHLTEQLRKVSEEEMKRRWSTAQTRLLERQERAWRALTDSQEAQARARARSEELEELEELRGARREREERAGADRETSWPGHALPRPSNIQLVGRSFVAGAQLAPLNPALGEYFRVEEGVLVMEVVEGTPAQEAGLVAGDVIVRVGSQDVSSLEDLRFGLGYVQGPLTVRVIRKGEALELRFFEKKEPRWREPREE